MTAPSDLIPVQRIACAVGAYVLVVQEAERLLKHIVPMMDDSDASISAILKRASALEKKTLGHVAKGFLEGCSGDTGSLKEWLERIVANRNEIVHHFTDRFRSLLADDRIDDVLEEIRRRHKDAVDLIHTLRPVAMHIVEALRDHVFAGTDEYRDMAGLCEALRTNWFGNADDQAKAPKCPHEVIACRQTDTLAGRLTETP